jgi:hypothetical protein
MAGFEGFGLFDPEQQDESLEEEGEDVFLSPAEMLDKVAPYFFIALVFLGVWLL